MLRRFIERYSSGLQVILQAAIVVFVLYIAYSAVVNYQLNSQRMALSFGWSFLVDASGFPVHQSWLTHSHLDSNTHVLLVGLLNTLVVSCVAMLLSSLLGIFLASLHYTNHPLLVLTAQGYTDIFRNVPLLVQIMFWYNLWIHKLPILRDSWYLGGMVINNRGVFVPDPVQFMSVWLLFMLLWLGLLAAHLLYQSYYRFALGLSFLIWSIVLLAGMIPWLSLPQLVGFNIRNALHVYPSFIGLCAALTTYTAAFNAEIIRGAMLAVPAGQIEVGRSLGLSSWQVYRYIVLPQILPAVLPNMSSQYLNIAKNSSLGRAVGYPEVFAVFAGTVLNQTGKAVEVMLLVMLIYLLLSLCIIRVCQYFDNQQRYWTERDSFG